jgi:hypothetical protein
LIGRSVTTARNWIGRGVTTAKNWIGRGVTTARNLQLLTLFVICECLIICLIKY